jgi:Ca2+:H+ antiporter
VARRILWTSLALTPAVLLARYAFHADDTTLFVLSALALVPLAWLIGEATDHAAQHTGSGVGGFLNASFGNAPELIIALFAVGNGLPNVVRGTITGSVVSNILLVLGAAMIAGGNGTVDTRSLRLQLAAVFGAVLVLLIPSVPGWHGSRDRHSLYLVTLPVAAVLLCAYLLITVHNLRLHRSAERSEPDESAWSLQKALGWLTVATAATAFVSEVLVHSLHSFAHAVGIGEFFTAVVIVAIVGNAAEHGGAVVIARRGNMQLATEIAITSSMQVAVFVAPAVALLSWIFGRGLPLAFRIVEIVTMAVAAVLAALVVWDGRSRRWEGFLLVGLYCLAAVWYALA